MDLKEFAALKVGDVIENGMLPGSRAKIVETSERGVRIEWVGSDTRFFYGPHHTSWMHWSKVDDV